MAQSSRILVVKLETVRKYQKYAASISETVSRCFTFSGVFPKQFPYIYVSMISGMDLETTEVTD
jgi:hypothetical protein